MAKYVDGFVLAIPKKNLDAYKKLAKRSGKLWRDLGALDYKECVADDVPFGKTTSFPRSVERKNSETVVFAWITYKSRAFDVTSGSTVTIRGQGSTSGGTAYYDDNFMTVVPGTQ